MSIRADGERELDDEVFGGDDDERERGSMRGAEWGGHGDEAGAREREFRRVSGGCGARDDVFRERDVDRERGVRVLRRAGVV